MKNTKQLKQRVEDIEIRLNKLECWISKIIGAITSLDIRTKGMCNGMSSFSTIMAEFIDKKIEDKKEDKEKLDNMIEAINALKDHCTQCYNKEN